MKRWIGWAQFLSRINSGGPRGSRGEVIVQMHYRDRSNPDVIENFRIGDGSSFLLTFLEGGTVDVDLTHVKEIKFEKVVQNQDARTYQVRVSLTNGRAFEGYSANLNSFSGVREGSAWTYPCLGSSHHQVEAPDNVARIVVRQMHGH